MTYVPRVDPDECSAHGDCVEIAPEVFRLDDDVATVIGRRSLREDPRSSRGLPGGRDLSRRR